MANVMSFKKVEIVGVSKEAAINDANLGFFHYVQRSFME